MGLEKSFLLEVRADNFLARLPYRAPLISLVRRCMSAKAKDRPSPLGLYRTTGNVLESCYTTMDGDSDRFRLYFRGNEINEMETGFHILRNNPVTYFLLDEQFPVADTLNDEGLRIRPPAAKESYPYKSDGRDFFKHGAQGFQKRDAGSERRPTVQDKCGFQDYIPHVFNYMTLPAQWSAKRFDSSDSSGSEATERYIAKMKARQAREDS
ncbi:hypothetical protein MMC26_006182 [Xylographa opegraphella]|nr:hypothetical protein [Xylographa opegraphella]